MAWEENPRICLHMQLIAILSRIGVEKGSSDTEKRARLPATKETRPNRGLWPNSAPAKRSAYTPPAP